MALKLEDFDDEDQDPKGPTPPQLDYIDGLAEALDLSPADLIDMAANLDIAQATEDRVVESMTDLTIQEASQLIEELKRLKGESKRRYR